MTTKPQNFVWNDPIARDLTRDMWDVARQGRSRRGRMRNCVPTAYVYCWSIVTSNN